MRVDSTTASQRRAARVAGLAYIFAILYVPVYLLTSAGLTVANDPVATLANVQANPVLFRVGIASSLVMFASVFVLIAALYVTVAPVNRNIALLGLVLRMPEATLGLVSVGFSIIISQLASGGASVAGDGQQLVQLANGGASSAAYTPQLVQFALSAASAAGTLNLLFMALGSLPFLYLFWSARYAPRVLIGFGILAYVLALVSAFTSILAPGSALDGMQMVLAVPVMLFELVFGLWLLIKTIDVSQVERPSERGYGPRWQPELASRVHGQAVETAR